MKPAIFTCVFIFSGFLAFIALVDGILIPSGGEWTSHINEKNYRIVQNKEGNYSYQEKRYGILKLYGIWWTEDTIHATKEAAWKEAMESRRFWKTIYDRKQDRKRTDWIVITN